MSAADQQLVVGVADEESSDFPQIGLEEMLGALSIQEVPPMVPVVPTVMDQDVPMTDWMLMYSTVFILCNSVICLKYLRIIIIIYYYIVHLYYQISQNKEF